MPVGEKAVSSDWGEWVCPHVIGGIPIGIIDKDAVSTRGITSLLLFELTSSNAQTFTYVAWCCSHLRIGVGTAFAVLLRSIPWCVRGLGMCPSKG
eukprot:4125957-Amphidinium_carterae.1